MRVSAGLSFASRRFAVARPADRSPSVVPRIAKAMLAPTFPSLSRCELDGPSGIVAAVGYVVEPAGCDATVPLSFGVQPGIAPTLVYVTVQVIQVECYPEQVLVQVTQ